MSFIAEDNILVLGAGQLGMAVLRAIAPRLKDSVAVTVVESPSVVASEKPELRSRVNEIKNLGASILPLDLVSAEKSELISEFKKFSTIVNCTGFVAGAGTQLRLTRAVIASGVKRFVPWQFGVDYDIIQYSSLNDVFDEQYDVRLLLRSQNSTKWLIISTGMFTSFLFEPSFGIVDLERKVVSALGSWDTKVTCTTPEDVGKMTAEILLHKPAFENEVVYIAGDTVSYRELAELTEDLTGVQFEYTELNPEKLASDVEQNPGPMEKYRSAFGQGDGMHWPKSKTYNVKYGFELTTVREWLADHLKKQSI